MMGFNGDAVNWCPIGDVGVGSNSGARHDEIDDCIDGIQESMVQMHVWTTMAMLLYNGVGSIVTKDEIPSECARMGESDGTL